MEVPAEKEDLAEMEGRADTVVEMEVLADKALEGTEVPVDKVLEDMVDLVEMEDLEVLVASLRDGDDAFYHDSHDGYLSLSSLLNQDLFA